MKRFVLPLPPNPDGIVRLYEKDYHYLVRVRRLKTGMSFDAILPNGEEIRVHILSTVDRILIGECLRENSSAPSLQSQQRLPPLALFQGLPKGNKMDTIVRQAAEGGISEIIPFESEYSTRNTSPEKLKRWERIIREARQQSGSAVKTEIKPPCNLEGLLNFWQNKKTEYPGSCGFMLHQEPLEKGTFHDYLGASPDYIALAVGPEGGFSPGDVSKFLAAGFKPVIMGNTILRTETAAVYGAAAIRVILMEKETWILRPKG